jgi:hypothetical protein
VHSDIHAVTRPDRNPQETYFGIQKHEDSIKRSDEHQFYPYLSGFCHAKRTFLALTAGESSRAVVLSARYQEEILILSF